MAQCVWVIFELQNLRFPVSEICLPLFEFEIQPEHKKTDSNLFIIITSDLSVYAPLALHSLPYMVMPMTF